MGFEEMQDSEESVATEKRDAGNGTGSDAVSWRAKVMKMAQDVAAREGCEIYDLDFVGSGGNRSLRVFIDKVGEGGVSIDDCSNVSRGLNLMLDVEDIIPGGAYNLEVSSPGLERPLRTQAHFERAKGSRAMVKAFESFAELNPTLDDAAKLKLGRSKQLEGTIVGVEGGADTDPGLVFDAENGGGVVRIQIPLSKITKANTVFVFEKHEKPKKKN